MMRCLALLLGAAAIAVAPDAARAEAAPTKDGFELCNRTRLNVVYAKALNISDKQKSKKNVIVSEGWFELAPGACEMIYPGRLEFRYYLVYAEAKNSNRKWTGDRPICVDARNFKITSDTCPANKNRRMFLQVDTGKHDTYTYDLK